MYERGSPQDRSARRRTGIIAALTMVAAATAVTVMSTTPASAAGAPVVVAWGNSADGRTAVPPGLDDITDVAAGWDFGLGLRANGTVVGWGSNAHGQTAIPAGLSNVIAVSAGYWHAAALRSNGTVASWGYNDYGQTNVPAGLSGVKAITSLPGGTVALKSDGTVVAWGYNDFGQFTVPAGLNGVSDVAGGYWHTLALKSDGTVVAWGDDTSGQSTVPAGLTGVKAVDAGFFHNLALKSDGTVVAWGADNHGQSTVPAGLSDVVAVAAGAAQSYALKSDGTIVAWGADSYGQSTVPAGLDGVTALDSNGEHVLALRPTTHVVAWGWNNAGQATVPAGLTGVVAVSAGQGHSLALKSDGTVAAWGSNGFGQSTVPSGLNGVAEISGGGEFSLVLLDDGTVSGWGRNLYGELNAPAGLGLTTIAGGRYHSLAITENGTVVAWGYNNTGQINVPVGLTGVIAVSAGVDHSLALKSDGTVVAWGSDSGGQRSVPTGLTGVVAISAGAYHSMALKSDGTVVAWGSNDHGQRAVPAGLSGVEAIAGGWGNSDALRANGTVAAWGRNADGETSVPTGTEDVSMLSTTGFHTLALVPPAPVVTVGSATVSVVEGDSGTANVSVNVVVSRSSLSSITVGFHTADGTATSPADYTSQTGAVVIPAGELSASATIAVAGDVLIEGDQSFDVVLDTVTAGTAVVGAAATTTVTITDDDTTTITITSTTVTEGSGPATVRVELTKAFADRSLTVNLSTADGSARAPADYSAGTSTLVVAPGALTSPTWSIPIADDDRWDPDETFTVTVVSHDETRPGLVTDIVEGQVTITDDDPRPVVSIGSLTMLEGDSGSTLVSFPVSLRHPAADPITLGWATANGSALAGSDYTAASGSVLFRPGDTHTTVEVAIRGDAGVEPNEYFVVSLSALPSGVDVAQAAARGVILNDDGARSLSVLDAEAIEGAGMVNVVVALSDPLPTPLVVTYATSNGTAIAPTDYTAASGTVTIDAGLTTATVPVLLAGDSMVETDETFRLSVSIAPTADVVVARAVGTASVVDDDTASVTLTQVSTDPVTEGAAGTTTSVKYAVGLSAAVSVPVTVGWTTDEVDPAEATAGTDFGSRTGAVTFQPGETNKFVYAPVRGDGLHESAERFAVTAWSSTAVRGVADAPTSVTTTIADDDPVPRISIGSVSLTEGDSGTRLMSFPVTLSSPSGALVTATFTTGDVTATASSDYTPVLATVTFLPGDKTEIVSVPVIGDSAVEPNEQFTAVLSEVVGALAGTLSATGTIIDDDAEPSKYFVTIRDLSTMEGNTGLLRVRVTVVLNQANATGAAMTVKWSTADGSATAAGNDYVAASGLVTFAPGVRTRTVGIDIKGDRVKEPNEAFNVQLRSPSAGLQLATKNAAVVTLVNDD